MSTTITPEHCKIVADWLDARGGTLGNETMEYQQSEIDCGTACCAAGALSIVSGRGHASHEVFDRIVGEELPALGRCYAVAARLCHMSDQTVGPVIAALFRDDWDGACKAVAATQQSDGSGVWIDGVQSGQTWGVACLFGSAQSRGQTGGVAWLHDSAQSHGQTGGEAWLYDSAQSHGMLGGTLYVRSPNAKVIDSKGGLAIWQEWRDGNWVETRREGAAP